MKKKIIIAIIIVASIAIPLSIKSLRGPKLKAVTVEKIQKRIIRSSILASGSFVHETEVKLSAEVIAKVQTISVKEGDFVKKNQLVLTLNQETFIADMERAKADLNLQKINIESKDTELEYLLKQWYRKKKLFDSRLIDEDKFDEVSRNLALKKLDISSAKERLLQAKAEVRKSQDRLNKTAIRSPIDGQVTSLNIKEGETAIASTTNIAGSSLMVIAAPGSMIAEIQVDEADINAVNINQDVNIYSVNDPETAIKGKVTAIGSSAKSVPGRQGLSFAIKIQLPKDKSLDKLRSGMSCRAEIFTTSPEKLLTIPQQATRESANEDVNSKQRIFVFIVKNGIARKKFIETDIADDQYMSILKGVSENQQVVTGPAKVLRNLRDKDAVKIIPD